MHNFHITLCVPQNCVLIVIAHRGCWVGELSAWGCYGLVSVLVLEILSEGAQFPLDSRLRLAPTLLHVSQSRSFSRSSTAIILLRSFSCITSALLSVSSKLILLLVYPNVQSYFRLRTSVPIRTSPFPATTATHYCSLLHAITHV